MERADRAIEAGVEQSSIFESFPAHDLAGERVGDAGTLFLERGRPRYVEIQLHGLFRPGRRLVPWDLATLDRVLRVHLQCLKGDLQQAPGFDPRAALDPQALRARIHFGCPPEGVDRDIASQAGNDERPMRSGVNGVDGRDAGRWLVDDLHKATQNGEEAQPSTSRGSTRSLVDGVKEVLEIREESSGGWRPPLDLMETDTGYLLALDVPGVRADELAVELSDGLLTVSGKRDGFVHTELRHLERPRGRFVRRFLLPGQVDDDAVQAELENGVLEVHISAGAPAKERTASRL